MRGPGPYHNPFISMRARYQSELGANETRRTNGLKLRESREKMYKDEDENPGRRRNKKCDSSQFLILMKEQLELLPFFFFIQHPVRKSPYISSAFDLNKTRRRRRRRELSAI
jgi:hypothetical protein